MANQDQPMGLGGMGIGGGLGQQQPAQQAQPPTMEQIMAMMLQQSQQTQALLERLVNTPAAPATVVHEGPRIKVATPDDFDGKQAHAEEFLRQCEIYFTSYPNATDTQKINIALSHMKGETAGPWAQRQLDLITGVTQGTAIRLWSDFRKQFKDNFADPDAKRTAQTKIMQIRQGTRSVAEYTIEFENYQYRSGFNDEALTVHFEVGLQEAVRRGVYGMIPMPTDLAGWKEAALQLNNNYRRYVEQQKSTPRGTQQHQGNQRREQPPVHNPVSRQTSAPSSSTSSRELPPGVPMDVDRARSRGQFPSSRTLVCFRCKQPGHMMKDCRSQVNFMDMDYEQIRAVVLAEERRKEEEGKAKEGKVAKIEEAAEEEKKKDF